MQQLMRGGIETHRRERKEYHNELMSVFMAEKMQQQAEEVKRLQYTVNQLIEERCYFKLNGVLWRISDGDEIKEKLTEFTQTTVDAIDSCTELACTNTMSPNSDSLSKKKKKKPSKYTGPMFILEPHYILYPQLCIDKTGEASLYLVSDKANQKQKHLNLPLESTCKVFLLNQHSRDESWVVQTDVFPLPYAGSVKLTDIPSKFLLDEAYNNNNTLELKLLFKIEQSFN